MKIRSRAKVFALAIIGKPNAGKSSIANCLFGHERHLVSEIAGTTVDAVETEVEINGNNIFLIDTAGLRRAPSNGMALCTVWL